MSTDTWARDTQDLAVFDFRRAVVEALREQAERDCVAGDDFLPGGQYPAAIACWRAAAQRRRAATALDGQQPVHADDTEFVTQACSKVRVALWARFAEQNGLAA